MNHMNNDKALPIRLNMKPNCLVVHDVQDIYNLNSKFLCLVQLNTLCVTHIPISESPARPPCVAFTF